MAGNISGLHQFANDTGPEPLKLLDDCYSALTIALNTLSTYSNFYSDTGTTNVYTVNTTQYQFASLTDGLQLLVRIANTNTGASTLNLNGLGAMPVLNQNGAPMEPGQLLAGTILQFTYNAARSAWQIGAGSAGGVLTEPFSVTSPGGQKLLWADTAGTGAAAPFSVKDSTNNTTLFFDGMAGLNVSAGPPGSRALDIFGGVNANPMVAQIHSGNNTAPGSWILWVGATDDLCQPGMSNGLYVMAGTNASDFCMQVTPLTAAGTANAPLYDLNPGNAFFIRGDRTGGIGPAPNQLVWDDAGHFTLTGTATLPMPPLVDLPGITITNPQQGDVLSYNSGTNQWVNAAPVTNLAHLTDVALASPVQGQSLTYNATTQHWVNGNPLLALGQLSDVTQSGPAAGQVLTYSVSPTPGWINATIPGYSFLTHLSIPGTVAIGDVLTWDGNGWVGAPPGQVATFPLTSLTDVNIVTPLNRQVLTWDAPNARWINAPVPQPSLSTLPDVSVLSQSQGQVLSWDATLNRWVNTALPGGSVIALSSLMDTNISDPQNNQVLTWDYASSRWKNEAIPPQAFNQLTGITLTGLAGGQALTYNGTSWVNSNVLTGPVTINAGTSNTLTAYGVPDYDTLNIRGGANTNTANPAYVARFTSNNGSVSGANNGVLIQAGTTAADQVLFVHNNAPTPLNLMRIAGDGSGYLSSGISGMAMAWTAAGAWTWALPPNQSCSIYGGINTVATSVLNVFASNASAPGTACGLYMQAGGNAADFALWILDRAGLGTRMKITGDGATSFYGLMDPTPYFTTLTAWTINDYRAWGCSVLVPNGARGNNLRIVSSGNSADYAISVYGPALENYFQIYANGQGNIGPNSTNRLAWDATGAFTINAPVSAQWQTTLRLTACPDGYALLCNGAPNATMNKYVGAFYTSATNAGGMNNGIYIQGDITGTAFYITNNSGQSLFQIQGGGQMFAAHITNTAGNYQIQQVASTGEIVTVASSIRYKHDVKTVLRSRAREIVKGLRTVSFRSKCKSDDPNQTFYGLIAEEVAEIDSNLVVCDREGRPEAVQYDRVLLMLLPLMQELLEAS